MSEGECHVSLLRLQGKHAHDKGNYEVTHKA